MDWFQGFWGHIYSWNSMVFTPSSNGVSVFFSLGIESRNPNMATPGSTLWISMDLRVLWAWEQWIVRGRISNGRIWTHRGFINYTSMLGSSARNMAFASRTFHLCWPAKNQRKRCRTAASAPEMVWNNASEANEWLHIWRLASFSQLVLESFLDDFDLVQYITRGTVRAYVAQESWKAAGFCRKNASEARHRLRWQWKTHRS